jgi:hypothetical protein
MVVTSYRSILKRIFLVVDASPLKRYTVALTVWLAREFKASVVIAHVATQSHNAHRMLHLPGAGNDEASKERMEEIRRVKSQIAGASIEVKTIYRESARPAIELNRLAYQRRADIVLMQWTEETAEMAEGLMGKSHSPVLMAGPGADIELGGRYAVRCVVFLANGLSEPNLDASYVFSFAKALGARLVIAPREPVDEGAPETELLREMGAKAEVNWQWWKPPAGAAEMDVAANTLAYLEQVQADLLIVSGGLVRAWAKEKSRTLQEIVQRAACPVMALPWS